MLQTLDALSLGALIVSVFGGYERWRLQFWMLQTLDASSFDALIVPRCDRLGTHFTLLCTVAKLVA